MIESITNELNRLFAITRTSDEFEFVNVLIGFNGMGDQRALTHLFESRSYIEDMKERYMNEEKLHSKTRLGLHLYCHIFEMNELYNILGNMVRIASNQRLRYLPDLYSQIEPHLTPTDKITRISDLAPHSHMEPLLGLINELYKNDLRNSFFHSSYSLLDNDYHIIKGKGVKIGNQIFNTLNIKEYILPLVDNTIGFITAFFNLIDDHKLSYQSNKIVTAYMPDKQAVVILGNEQTGLVGFQTFVGSWVKLNSQTSSGHFVEAMNIRLQREPDNPLEKDLENYIEKLRPHGKDFNAIRDRVINSSDGDLLRMLAVVYYNWGNNTVRTAEGKPDRQHDAILVSGLDFYNLSIATDPNFDRVYLNKASTIIRLNQSRGTLTDHVRNDTLALFEKALELNPVSFEALLNSARMLQELGNVESNNEKQLQYFNESINRLDRVIVLNPHDSHIYKNLGWIKTRLANLKIDPVKNFTEAVSHYQTALDKDPDLENNLSLASALENLSELQNTDEAIASIKKSILVLSEAAEKYGINSDLCYRLGNKFYALGKLEDDTTIQQDAIKNFEKAIELDATNISAINNLSHCQLLVYVNEGGHTDSKEMLYMLGERLENILSTMPNNLNAIHNLLYVNLELAKISNEHDRNALLTKSFELLTEIEKLEKIPDYFDFARTHAIAGNKEESIKFLTLWIAQGNKWGVLGFTADFEILADDPEFKKITV